MKTGVSLAAALAAVVVAAAAGSARADRPAQVRAAGAPPIQFGVADDNGKYADDGGAWFDQQLKGANLTEERWALLWNPDNPTSIDELAFLQRAAPRAQADGVHVVLALYSRKASQHDPDQFCAWAGNVAATVKQWGITDLIVGNEPNIRTFWVPQKDADGNDVAAPAYEALLAKCYDAIKAANPAARVIGMGLSPHATTDESNHPLVFLRDVGAAYRASGRTKPIMDQLAIHPYPNPATGGADAPDVGYKNPDDFGIPNLDRVKQAVWDAFHGTAQPTTLNGLTLRIDEVGWQVITTTLSQYFGVETAKVITEQLQMQYLKTMIEKYFACDPAVTDVLLFHLLDERYRGARDESGNPIGGGWQSGLMTYGGPGVSQPRPAYAAIGADAAAGRAACSSGMISWQPAGSAGSGTDGPIGQSVHQGFASSGDPQGVLQGVTQTRIQNGIASLALRLSRLGSLTDRKPVFLSSLFLGPLGQLQALLGPASQSLDATALLLRCPPRTCTAQSALLAALGGHLRRLAGVRATPLVLATGAATVAPGSAVGVKLASKARAAAGQYFLAVVLRGKTDVAKQYAVAVQLRSVVHKAKPKPKPKHAKK